MFFTKRKAIILIIICSIFFILTYKDVRSEEIKEISGNAKIIDGDTIKMGKEIKSPLQTWDDKSDTKWLQRT